MTDIPKLQYKLKFFTLNSSLFLHRLTRNADTEFLEDLTVNLGEHYGRVNLTAAKIRELFKSLLAVLVSIAENAESNEHLVSMKSWVLTTEIFNLRLLDRLNHALWNELNIMVNSCKMLCGIQDESRRTAEKL